MCCCESPSEWPPPLQISPIIKYLLLTGPVINSKIASSLHLRLPLGPEHWIHYLLFSELAGSFHFCPSMEIVALLLEEAGARAWELCARFCQSLHKTCSSPPAQRQRDFVAFLAKPRFCNPGLWSSQQSSALNEFQFPGFITQPGAGNRGLVVTPKLVRISPCSCQLVHCLSLCGFITCFCGLMFHVFFSTRSVAFPDLLSRPFPEAGGGQLQATCRGSLCVQQSSWEEAGNPLEEGRTSPGPA